jgi:diguanylate cyclase (GGDEF)-like protein
MGAGSLRARTGLRRRRVDVVTGLLVLVVLVTGAVLTVAISSLRRDELRGEYEARYRAERVQAMRALQIGVERYATVLRGTAGLMVSSEHVDLAEFSLYGRALALHANYPGIGRIGFLEAVPWDEREPFMAELRREVPGAIDEVAAEPHELAIVTLMTGGPRGIGRDLGADPVRRAALDRARDLGRVQMTKPLALLIDPRTPPDLSRGSVAMYAPVYDTSPPPETIAERRRHLVGWTTTAFQIEELAPALGLDDTGVRARLLADETSFETLRTSPYTRVESIELFGQVWRVVFEPAPDIGEPSDVWTANLWAGAISTIAIATVIGLLGTQRARLRREVTAAVARSEAANSELERSAQFRGALLENLQVGVVATDLDGNVQVFNLDSEGLHDGLEPFAFRGSWSEALGLRSLAGSLLPEQQNPMHRALHGTRVRNEEYLVRPRGGTERVVLCNGQPITDSTGAVLGAVVALHDITRLKDAQQRLADLAHHDPLTGLPNRVALMERTHAALVRAQQTGDAVAMLFLDLDGFKSVNDEHGHDVGDELLRVAAARLRNAVRADDTPARLGGDEFVVLCDRYADESVPARLVERVTEALARPYPVSGALMQIEASVGLAVAEPLDDASTLLRRADQAMYKAKLRRREATDGEVPPVPAVDQTWVDR